MNNVANTVKILKELHEKNLIAGKTAGSQQLHLSRIQPLSNQRLPTGKQIVYHALQTAQDHATPEELAALDTEITALREDLAASKAEEKAQRAVLSNFGATFSIQDLRSSVQTLESAKTDILARLACHREGKVQPISAEERNATERELQVWTRQAAVRKKIANELFLMLLDGMQGKTKEELWVSAAKGWFGHAHTVTRSRLGLRRMSEMVVARRWDPMLLARA